MIRPGRLLRRLLLLAVLLTAAVWAFPRVRAAVLVARLLAEDPPSSLPVPVQGMAPDRLVDSWGNPRPGGRSHQGIDIFAPRGTPVLSTTRGVLTGQGENALGGRIVLVTGPGGHRHYYAHLDAWGVQTEGDWVEALDVIGYVGTTGNAEGGRPHLHYGIYTGAGAVNPFPLLVLPSESDVRVDG